VDHPKWTTLKETFKAAHEARAEVEHDALDVLALLKRKSTRRVDVRLPGKGDSNSHGARPPNHHDEKVDSDQ